MVKRGYGRWRAAAIGAGAAVVARGARYAVKRVRRYMKSRPTVGRKRKMNMSKPRIAKKSRGFGRKRFGGLPNYLNQGPGNELYQWKRTARIQRPTLKKFLYPTTISRQDRFQGLTNFDTNGGYARLSYHTSIGENDPRWLPMAIFDLTSFNNDGAVPPYSNVGYKLGWQNSGFGADYARSSIRGQVPDGDATTNTWTITSGTDNGIYNNISKVYLKWIDIRLNLYGARKRTTKFEAQLVQFSNDFGNLHMGPLDNPAGKNNISYMERPLLFNNLQISTHKPEKMRVLKKWKWTVGPTTSIDLNTTTGKIQEAKIFLKMNKAINLDYSVGNNAVHVDVGDGADYDVDTTTRHRDPKPPSRVYLLLKAFCPALTSLPSAALWDKTLAEGSISNPFGGTALNNADEPSFDFMIRRKYYCDK
ncbi:putative capsid protein [Sewage-associated circular DNA virus-21]|uniref:putative capsid protein n=1 Tax=Sewage-associated circular DNA virus-21 TaxID=1592088 RepID=UPI000585C8FE|nr:putative capsid protein [Sewage-associated circular DNA virus-21]AJD07534.1 putative capsid protein [Sewage-associated circular DNA virus-21]